MPALHNHFLIYLYFGSPWTIFEQIYSVPARDRQSATVDRPWPITQHYDISGNMGRIGVK